LVGKTVYIGGYPMMIYDKAKDANKLVKAEQRPYCDSGPIREVTYQQNRNTAVMIYDFTGVATGKGQSGASI
jgi:hypothetical protein